MFVVRDVTDGVELATFWHPGGGLQIPAGTVEPGEPYDLAALREAREETGLTDIVLTADLGAQELIMPLGRALVLIETNLHLSPAGAETPWRLSRTGVELLQERDGWWMVRYQERDLEQPELLVAQLTGWVPSEALTLRQERRFFVARSDDRRGASWSTQGEPERTFTVSWQPLRPRPDLVGPQQPWLDRLDEALNQPSQQ